MIVSLNGVIQQPTTAYTVAGATLSFASALTSNDTIDFVILLGNVLDIGTPSDDTVATAKIQNDAVTLAKMASGTDGNIISFDASGNPVAVATGDDGQVLTSSGAGAVCAFEDAGGAWTKIATADYSSGVADFTITDCFTSTYPIYKVYLYNVLAAADGVELRAYFLEDDDSVVGNWQIASDGAYIDYSGNTSGTTNFGQDDSDNIRFTGEEIQSEATKISALEMTIYQPYESVHTVVHYNYLLNSDNDSLYQYDGIAYLSSTTSLRSLKFQSSNGGNFSAYKTVIYGVKTT
jgi:hypothetical protein